MINEKAISDKKMIEYIKPIIGRYYEDDFLKNVSIYEKTDFNPCQEFKKYIKHQK